MKCVLVVLISLNGLFAFSQPPKKYVLSCKGKQLDELLVYLDSRYGLKFSYDPELMSRYQVTVDFATNIKAHFLKAVFKGLPLSFKPTSTTILIIPDRANEPKGSRGDNLTPIVPKTISGYVRDAETGENLIGATIYDKNSKKGVITNVYGFYSLTLNTDSVHLTVSFVGYQAQEFNKPIKTNTEADFDLLYSKVLDAVTVVGEEPIEESPQMGLINVPIKQIKQVPMILGEVDVLKALQLLPGIQGGTEGTSGIYVRGGGPDQNLILIDGVPVYNASHLFGFFSVFNADAINNVSVMKGGFPARYGGRLSSVIDISMKEGNNQKLGGIGSIGLISSKFMIEGPIKDENTSFIVSARRTYLDLLVRPFMKASTDGDEVAGYFFEDFNAKINHRFSNKDRLYLSFYGGKDKFYSKYKSNYSFNNVTTDYEDEAGLKWGNIISALRWNHLFSQKLFANITGTFSRYNFKVFEDYYRKEVGPGINEVTEDAIEYRSGIKDFALKVDFDYLPTPSHNFKFGVMGIHHTFTPEVFVYESNVETDTVFGALKTRALEFSAYAEDDITLSDRIRFNVGIHTSMFNIRKKTFSSLQPRLSGRFLIDRNSSIKVSYSMMRQFVHLLTNSSIGLPTDLWVPATDKLQPQKSWQAGLGLSRSMGSFEISIEGFYKKMDNLIAYKEGGSLNIGSLFEADEESVEIRKDGEDWEEKVVSGEGDSYGLEFLVQRKAGRLSGWLGYTYSKTSRQFDDLNFGIRYPYRYDRRHDLSLVTVYEINDRVKFSGTWVYASGNVVSIPDSEFQPLDDLFFETFGHYSSSLKNYPSRNNFRMNPYHRLDLGISMSKKKRRGLRTWSFGAYNSYSRRNPFYVDIRYDNGKKKYKQYSLFPIIPYMNYSFEF